MTYTRERVDRTAVDVKVILRKHLGALVDRSSGTIEDTTKHILRDTKLQALACEFDLGL
jgi:hypothetical protein